ncbi:RagB/SusD family nutrient uptake outer membrane protein [Sinomicrobium pectinilyticum]|uniref:RagB/SusD family nutrient uptake outer membrane protein n=1 Tax=Sinomicrobium pectinilyticum TaxID=1084421 RepID=A0A3N0ER17_SINP1|nr:RagB/SusD family nutrient uptake outer membrane protein [Sinomicrobium pectinilyticum]
MDAPFGQLPHEEVFKDEATATSAVTTLYAKLRDEVLICGGQTGVGFLMGLYADELDYYALAQPAETFYRHQVIASDITVNNLWNSAYNMVYMSNSVLEGLENSQSLAEETKNQLKGEALFVRALVHFYLVNLFGDVPYITITNYRENDKVTRTPEIEVYENIVEDLTKAKSLISNTYITGERTRPNKWVVSALLARVYLYLEQWQDAEIESSQVINTTTLYDLQVSIDEVFLKESPSAIWQLKPKNEGDNTAEGTLFFLSSGPPQISALNPALVQEMEDGDLRKQHWISEVTDGNTTWYFPYKYRQNQNTGTSLEYSIVFRLAEQYLIRAEARARQGNVPGAQQDINVMRERAGLSDITASSTEELIQVILKERRFELFTEHGHRWFDLRRSGLAGQVLAPVKPGWTPTDILLPIPEAELLMNPNLQPQNQGY